MPGHNLAFDVFRAGHFCKFFSVVKSEFNSARNVGMLLITFTTYNAVTTIQSEKLLFVKLPTSYKEQDFDMTASKSPK